MEMIYGNHARKYGEKNAWTTYWKKINWQKMEHASIFFIIWFNICYINLSQAKTWGPSQYKDVVLAV